MGGWVRCGGVRDGVECDGVWVLGGMGRMGRVVWGVDWVSANPLYIRTLYVYTFYIHVCMYTYILYHLV